MLGMLGIEGKSNFTPRYLSGVRIFKSSGWKLKPARSPQHAVSSPPAFPSSFLKEDVSKGRIPAMGFVVYVCSSVDAACGGFDASSRIHSDITIFSALNHRFSEIEPKGKAVFKQQYVVVVVCLSQTCLQMATGIGSSHCGVFTMEDDALAIPSCPASRFPLSISEQHPSAAVLGTGG